MSIIRTVDTKIQVKCLFTHFNICKRQKLNSPELLSSSCHTKTFHRLTTCLQYKKTLQFSSAKHKTHLRFVKRTDQECWRRQKLHKDLERHNHKSTITALTSGTNSTDWETTEVALTHNQDAFLFWRDILNAVGAENEF